MSLVPTFCWREWRAQRSVLLAYTGMGLAALCLVFLLMPEHWWEEDGRRALSLSWFLVVGFVGVIAFATPALVRSEFGSKHDHFVRRLPGALLPSFGGKLLFLALAAVALPLVCLSCGQLFLLAIDKPWYDLFESRWDGYLALRWPWPILAIAPASLLIPWVWAIGTWLPGGRMALGGTTLFVLVLGLGVFAVLRQSPDIEKGIAWQSWLWLVPVLGLTAAAVSWTKGRRGGGPLRSARFGLTAAAIGLAPPSVWLADRVWDYHHPDMQSLARLHVWGATPDAQCILAFGAANDTFRAVPVRIDLRDGSARQLGGIDETFWSLQHGPQMSWSGNLARYWRFDPRSPRRGDPIDVLDLTTGALTSVASDDNFKIRELPDAIAQVVAAEARELTQLRAPGGRRVWFEGDDVCIEAADGSVERVRWEGKLPRIVRACGHGFWTPSDKQTSLFDVTTRRRSDIDAGNYSHWLVQGTRITTKANGAYGWERHGDDGSVTPIPGLQGAGILGLFDDTHLLCAAGGPRRRTPLRLFLWSAADGVTTELPLPAATPVGGSIDVTPLFGPLPSLLARDPAGRVWLRARNATDDVHLLLDAGTLALSIVNGNRRFGAGGWSNRQLLGWPDARSAIVHDGSTIVRLDVDTGECTVLFPRR